MRPRLKILYERARILLGEGAGFHDIACDHAKLAAAISKARPDVRIEASDILSSAIDRARATTDLSENELFVSDGFSKHCLQEGDVVVIAGVGGHTIIDLLEDACNYSDSVRPKLQMLLQTNHQVDILRGNLYDREEVLVLDEFLVRDRNQIYVNFQLEFRLPWVSLPMNESNLYRYFGGGPELLAGPIPAGSVLEEYLHDCLNFAQMKITAVTDQDEQINWQRHYERVLDILKRGSS